MNRAGLRQSAVNLKEVAERLLQLHEVGDGADEGASELMPIALGLVGQPARMRYNRAFRDFRDRLWKGAQSASAMAEVITANENGYAQAEHQGVQALLSLQANADRPLDQPLLRNDTVNPLFEHQGDDKYWQPAVMAAGTFEAGLRARRLRHRIDRQRWVQYLDDYDDPSAQRKLSRATTSAERARAYEQIERSRIALQSGRTAAMLKVAGRMSIAASVGTMVWAAAMVPRDEILDRHIAYWAAMARDLDSLFGGGDPAGRAVLAQTWQGETMEVADKKLRAFMTAGIQLSDKAVAHAHDLEQAVKSLNALHDKIFALTVVWVLALWTIRLSYTVNPLGALGAQEYIGRNLTKTVVAAHAAISALMATQLYMDVDGQPEYSGPGNVPSQDFPEVNA
ncbi:hypothetical protein [Nonomuraea cavernae]|uniref:hypothetical protein n=1 Tax=Nonomuraea cavernae TaxID=2045107 RepID=UPI0033F7481E